MKWIDVAKESPKFQGKRLTEIARMVMSDQTLDTAERKIAMHVLALAVLTLLGQPA